MSRYPAILDWFHFMRVKDYPSKTLTFSWSIVIPQSHYHLTAQFSTTISAVSNKPHHFTKGTLIPCLRDRFFPFDTLRTTGFFTAMLGFISFLIFFCVSALGRDTSSPFLIKTQTKKPWPISSSSFSQRTTHAACFSLRPSTTKPPRPSSGAMSSNSQAGPRLFSAFATTSSFSSL